jgi:hypothetical protein
VEYKARLDRNYRTSLKVWWAPEFGCLSILDPFTGEVYEVDRGHPNTPRWMTWRAMDEKARRRGTSSGSAWRASTG